MAVPWQCNGIVMAHPSRCHAIAVALEHNTILGYCKQHIHIQNEKLYVHQELLTTYANAGDTHSKTFEIHRNAGLML